MVAFGSYSVLLIRLKDGGLTFVVFSYSQKIDTIDWRGGSSV